MLSYEEALEALNELLKQPETITLVDIEKIVANISAVDSADNAITIFYSNCKDYPVTGVNGIWNTDVYKIVQESDEYFEATIHALKNKYPSFNDAMILEKINEYTLDPVNGAWAIPNRCAVAVCPLFSTL